MGFNSSVNFPYEKKQDDYVVGVFGGSVAFDFVKDASEEFSRALKQHNPELQDKKIIVLNFALPAGEQPQQFFISSYFLQYLDLTVNIDGFNTLILDPEGFPIEFPHEAQLYLVDSSERAKWVLVANIARQTKRALTALPLMIPGLSHSQFYYLFWDKTQAKLDQMMDFFLDPVRSSKELTLSNYAQLNFEDDQNARVQLWKKFTFMQGKLAEQVGKQAYFFLQPNLHLPGSKIFSEKEQEFLARASFRDLPIYYRKLSQSVQELREENVKAHDLSMVFSATTETVYRDACCHLNPYGNSILAQTIASKIRLNIPSKRFLAAVPKKPRAPKP